MSKLSSAASHRRSRAKRRMAVFSAAAVAAAGLGAIPLVMTAHAATDLAHQALPAKDGWAASGTGTTGGSAADAAHVFTVSTRAQLVKALGSSTNTTAKIIQVEGTINANGRPGVLGQEPADLAREHTGAGVLTAAGGTSAATAAAATTAATATAKAATGAA